MSYKFVKTTNGSAEVYEDIELAAVSVAKDTVLYNVSGYASNASAAAITSQTVIGVVSEAVDNSGGSVGDLSAQILVNEEAVFEAASSGTLAKSQRWTNVTMDTVANFDENDAVDDYTGVIRIRGFISTSLGVVGINHQSPRA